MGMGENFNHDTPKSLYQKQNKPKISLNWENSQENQKVLAEKERIKEKIYKKSMNDRQILSTQLESRENSLLEKLYETNRRYGDLGENKKSIFNTFKNYAESGIAQINNYGVLLFGDKNNNIRTTSEISQESKSELRIYQDVLINKILGKDKGFDDEYIKGFDDNRGNFLENIKDYELYISGDNAEDINSTELFNYLQYLNNKGILNVWTLREKFGSKLLIGIGKLWKNNEGGTITQRLLKEAGIEKIINKVASFNDIIKNPTTAIHNISKDQLPSKKEIEATPINILIEFNKKNSSKPCTLENGYDKEKFSDVLKLSNQVELEKRKIEFKEKFEKHIIKRLKNKYNGKIPEKLQEKINIKSKENLETLLKLIETKPCAFDLLSEGRKLQKQFFIENKEYLHESIEPLTIRELKSSISPIIYIQKNITKSNILEIEEKIKILKINPRKNKEEIIKLNILLKKKEKSLPILNRVEKVSSNITLNQLDQYDTFISNGMSSEEAANKVIQENKDLKNIFKIYNHNNEDEEKKYVENKEENNEYYIDEDDYIPSNGGYSIKLENGKTLDGLIISPDEKKLTTGNPEALKNLINFYKFFKDLNLEGVWKYRKELALSIGSVNINLNDNDSVNEAELLKFGKKLIQVINKLNTEITTIPLKTKTIKLSENIGNINSLKSELRNYSGANSDLSNNATYNIKGEDKFTASLRNYGIIGGAYFHTMQLRELMK